MNTKLLHRNETNTLTKEQNDIITFVKKQVTKGHDYKNVLRHILKKFKDSKLISDPEGVYIFYTDPNLDLGNNQIFLSVGESGDDFFMIDIW